MPVEEIKMSGKDWNDLLAPVRGMPIYKPDGWKRLEPKAEFAPYCDYYAFYDSIPVNFSTFCEYACGSCCYIVRPQRPFIIDSDINIKIQRLLSLVTKEEFVALLVRPEQAKAILDIPLSEELTRQQVAAAAAVEPTKKVLIVGGGTSTTMAYLLSKANEIKITLVGEDAALGINASGAAAADVGSLQAAAPQRRL